MAGNVLIKNANGNTVTLQNPDTNLADVVVDTSKIASKQYVDDADALKVALSSFTGTNQSLVNNGYQKLPGGLIIQWGSSGLLSGSPYSSVAVTFPIAFPVACVGFSAISTGAAVSVASSGQSNTGTTLTNSSAVTSVAKWIAIGY